MTLALAGIFSQREPYDDGSVLFIIEPHLNYRIGSRIEMFTQAHVPCQVYSVAISAAGATPSKAQIKAGQDSTGSAAVSAANGTDVGKGIILNLTGLTKNTTYKICTYLDNDPDSSAVHEISIATAGGATISAALKMLPGSVFDFSGDSVTLTGTDVDSVLNSFYTPYGDTSPRASVTLKPVYAASTGPNSTPVIKFDGTNKAIVSGTPATPAVCDFQSITFHLLFKAINTTTTQCVVSNMISPSTGTQGSRGFRILIGFTSNNITVQVYDQSQVVTTFTVAFSDTTNFHLLTFRYRSTTDGASVLQVYLDGVAIVNSSTLNRMGVPVDTPFTFGGFTFPSNIFPGRYDLSRCTVYQLAHTNEEVNFAWAEFNTKYGLSIPMLP